MSTSAKLASFQAKIAKKATEISYKDTALPTAAVNILDSFLAASKPSTSVSNTYRIDMCPDFTPAFLYLLLNAQNDRATLAAAKNPKVSIYTYVAYQLHIIYVWFLLHDLYVNPLDCKFADTLLDDKFFVEAIEDALEYPVTKPILDVISFWSATCLENQQNIWICPSFANYLHHTHFGRSFPVSILFAAHNATAQNSANAKYADLLYQFATTSLYTIDKFVPGPFDATPAERKRTYTADHYFSLLRPDATHNTRPAPIDSKVNQILLSFLNFDNQKSNKAAAPYASIPIAATVHNERHGFLNPYVMLTCLTRKNTSELQTVYNAVKSVILLQKLSNTNLAACFTSVPSSGSANHGYSNFPSPHWNAWPAATIADPDDKVKKMSDTPLADHQSAMAFKTHHLVAPTGLTFPTLVRRALTMFNLAIGMRSTPNWPGNLTAVRAVLSLTNPDQETTLVPVAATTETGDISTSPSHAYTTVPQADDNTDVNDITDDEADNFPTGPFKQFDEHKDVYPNVKIIMPQGHSVDSAPLVALRGLIIYSEDLTAAAVPQLTSDSEVYDDCAQFLQSAVPFSVTHLATDFQSKFVRPSRATAVTRLAAVSQPVALMIRSHNAVYMPHLERNVFHYGYDRLTYGLTTPTARQRIPLFSQTFLGHTVHTRARTNAAHINAAPTNTPTGHLLVWSPYTFRAPSFEIDNDKDDLNVTAADALRATYFLTNLRTLFGTSQVVVEVKSPIHSLPSV